MEHLAARGITCPTPVHDRQRQARSAGSPGGRRRSSPSSRGMWVRRPRADHCAAVGEALGRPASRRRGLRPDAAERPVGRRTGGRSIEPAAARADEVSAGARRRDRGANSTISRRTGRRGLPTGVIHADLFPDNVFFLGGKLSGLIDFYFACNDMLAYDVAICINAWCFETDGSLNVTKSRALLVGLSTRVRPFARRRDRGPAAARPRRGAPLPAHPALRLADGAGGRAGRARRTRSNTTASSASTAASPTPPPTGSTVSERRAVAIWTDGACSGNPGPGRLGRGAHLERSREGALAAARPRPPTTAWN